MLWETGDPEILADYKIDYSYDDYGNITSKKEGKVTTTYSYDKNNRVTQEIKVEKEITTITRYTYDANGNQISEVSEIIENDDLTKEATAGIIIAGEAGEASKKEVKINAVLRKYNLRNQLVYVATNEKVGEYAYDHNGLRIRKTINGETTKYIWEKNHLVAEIKEDDSIIATYLYGTSLISQKDEKGKEHYYFYNAHGDVIGITDEKGHIEKRYEYNAYGEDFATGEEIHNPLKYFGQYYDEETKTYYLRARYYNPAIGRFISEDTYAGDIKDPLSLNRYLYGQGNPVHYVDENGNFAISALLIHLGDTAMETLPDIMLDMILEGEDFSLVKSATTNFGFNLIPLLGETKTAKKVAKVTKLYGITDLVENLAKYADEFVAGYGKHTDEVVKGTKHLNISADALKWLTKGDADNVVYYGIKNGEEVYTGITKQDLAKRLYQHNYSGKKLDDLVEQVGGLTRNQARAVEQYLIENGSANALNKINSIGSSHRYYDDAMKWAEKFINSLD